MSAHLYNFGLSQEDERTEATALGIGSLGSHDRVLSLASAGDMPLSLLALGAESVVAVDVDPHQLHLARLKAAAVQRLDREDAIRFLGFMPASLGARAGWLRDVMPGLRPDARLFWEWHEAEALRGAIWAGRFERYLRRLVGLVTPLIGLRSFEHLIACTSLDEQRVTFDRTFDRPRIRAIFRVAFHPMVYAVRGLDPRGLIHRRSGPSLGDQFFGAFRDLCTMTPAAGNHLLQLMVLGRVVSTDAVPEYLTSRGVTTVRARLDHLAFHEQDLVRFLRAAPPAVFNRAHLSNIVDWLPLAYFNELLRLLAAKMQRPARLVWRFLHADREPPPDVAARAVVDRALGEKLRRRDRFPFYGIVPVRLEGDG
jgi:S-adenosylmethionine:diacylglycerol 3-amino-3-carboxypropyl transferase